MHPAIRSQTSTDQDDISLLTGLDSSDLPDLARQEFRDEADVNQLLSRYGVGVPLQQQPQFGEVDWDLDLHSAFITVDRAQHAFNELPHELKTKYKTTHAMLDAMNSGELGHDLQQLRDAETKKAADLAAAASTPPTPEPSA